MIGGETMFGKIASFMELGFTYQEVMNLPIRNLVMFQRDKVRVAYGKVVREMTEDEEEAYFNLKNAEK